ncbi:MAG: enoyl-CoA hydratase/isomerase family protein, partial [Planctomycetota bacterium]
TEAFERAGKDDAVRAVVLAGTGKSFCAGADVNWMKRMVDYTFEENVQDARTMSRMLRAIRECPRPVIARVHGAAIGGGVGLVAACDLAAAREGAVFSLSEAKLGIAPAVISPFVLEKIGPGQARRLALTAERFDAVEAKRIGLIHEVAPDEAGLDAWIERAVRHIRSNGPKALSACKRLLSRVAGTDWDEVEAYTTRCIAELRASPEGQEGLRSFLEKRKPDWATDA